MGIMHIEVVESISFESTNPLTLKITSGDDFNEEVVKKEIDALLNKGISESNEGD